MKYADLLNQDRAALDQQVRDSKKELFNLRFQKATGQLENTSRFRAVRRDVARIKTALRAKQDAN